MTSFFIIGFLVGVVSLIPGISGGTIIFISKKYEEINYAIANYKKHKKEILVLVSGIVFGAFVFARIAEWCFKYIPNETTIFFIGLVLFSLPSIKNDKKINKKLFLLGALVIALTSLLAPNTPKVYTPYPKISVFFVILFGLCGVLDGFFTIIPGISGSMMMMILGPYYLLKSYLANFNLQNLIFLIPLSAYFLGDICGINMGSKVSLKLFKDSSSKGISLILGLVVMSLIVITPFSMFLGIKKIAKTIIVLAIAYLLTQVLNQLTAK